MVGKFSKRDERSGHVHPIEVTVDPTSIIPLSCDSSNSRVQRVVRVIPVLGLELDTPTIKPLGALFAHQYTFLIRDQWVRRSQWSEPIGRDALDDIRRAFSDRCCCR